MKCVRLFADSEGETHLEDMEVEFSITDFAPPAKPVGVAQPIPATQLVFIHTPLGWAGDWHPSPARQYCLVVSGELEFTVTDGATRRFGPGEVVLMEDTTGKGHLTKSVGGEDGHFAMVQTG